MTINNTGSVDSRVVSLAFENGQFEKHAEQSLRTMSNLKKGLDFSGIGESLSVLSGKIGSMSFDGVATSISGLDLGFAALAITAITAFERIANAAITAGSKMISALTIDPIMAGFSEYETQMGAIQTILANTSTKGTTLNEVTAALDELNAYSDKTIYNFTEMTKNIGTFTAAGISLETSTEAIKGIANLAAVSGSNSQQASTAMYQLSQALAAGRVSLMDWNSVVNAGMGGQVFQDALKETARTHGIAIDDMIAKEGSFRNTLQNGWLSTDILTETLSKFTGDLTEEQLRAMGLTEEQIQANIKLGQMANDAATKIKTFSQLWQTLVESAQSGWAKSWQIIIGDFEEAKKFFTEVNDIIGAMIGSSADARNALLQGWKDLGGRDVVIESLRDVLAAILAIVKPLQEAFADIFPPMTAQTLYDITAAIRSITSSMIISEETADKLKRIFSGLFAILDIVRMAFLDLIGPLLLDSAGGLIPIFSDLLGFLANIGDTLVGLRDSIKSGNVFKELAETIKVYIGKAEEFISSFLTNLRESFESVTGIDLSELFEFFDKITESVKPLQEKSSILSGALNLISSAFDLFVGSLGSLIPIGLSLGSKILEVVTNIFNGIVEAVGNIDFVALFDAINTGLTTAILISINNFISGGGSIFGKLSDLFAKLTKTTDKVGGILDTLRTSLEAYQNNLKANTLLQIAAAVGILALALLVLSTIEPTKLASSVAVITGMFVELTASLNAFSGIAKGMNLGSFSVAMLGLIAISTSLLILAGVLAILSQFESEVLLQSVLVIGVLLATITTFMKYLSGVGSNILPVSIGLMGISLAMLVLSGAISVLANIPVEGLVAGVGAIAALLASLVVFTRTVGSGGNLIAVSTGLVILSVAMVILSGAISKLAGLEFDSLMQGVIAISALLSALSIFVNTLSAGGMNLIAVSLGIIGISTGLYILVSAVSVLASLKVDQLVNAVGALGVILTELALFSQYISTGPQLILGALGLILLGVAVNILATALINMASLSWEELSRGLVAMAGALGIAVAAISFIPPTAIVGALSLIGVGLALQLFAASMRSFAEMSWDDISRALVTLAGSLVIIGVALTMMQTSLLGSAALMVAALAISILVPSLQALASLKVDELMMAMLSLAATFTVLGLAAYLLTPVIPSLLSLALAIAGIGIGLGLIGIGGAALAFGISAMSVALMLLLTTIIGMLATIVGSLPMLLNAVKLIALGLLQVIIEVAPALAEALIALLDGILNVLIAIVPKLVTFIGNLLMQLGAVLIEFIPVLVELIVVLLTELVKGLGVLVPIVVDTALDLLTAFMKSIRDHLDDVVALAIGIVESFIRGLTEGIPGLIDASYEFIVTYINSLADAVDKYMPELIKAFAKLGTALVNGLVSGVTGSRKIIDDGIKKLGKTIVNFFKDFFGIRSPSTVFIELGKNLIQGLINGIKALIPSVLSTIVQFLYSLITTFTSRIYQFVDVGRNYMTNLLTGLGSMMSQIFNKASDIASMFINRLKNYIKDLYKAGVDFVQGFIDGLESMLEDVVEAVKELGTSVIDNLKEVLGIQSPSREAMAIAGYMVAGFVSGLDKSEASLSDRVQRLGRNALEKMRDSILTGLSDMDNVSNPVITPVLDLSSVRKTAQGIGSLLDGGVLRLNLNTSNLVPATVPLHGIQNGSGSGTSQPSTVNFVQNITSPKPLNRFGIYQDTKTLLKSLKGR